MSEKPSMVGPVADNLFAKLNSVRNPTDVYQSCQWDIQLRKSSLLTFRLHKCNALKVGFAPIITDFNSPIDDVLDNYIEYDGVSGELRHNQALVQGSLVSPSPEFNGVIEIMVTPSTGQYEVYNNKCFVGEGVFPEL